MTASRREELDWLAFQYLLDELSAAERAEFERLLADDPAACTALADAVELQAAARQAFAGAEPSLVVAQAAEATGERRRPQRRRPILRWTGYAAAASLLLWLALGAPVPHRRPPRSPSEQLENAHLVALAWSELRSSNALADLELVTMADSEVPASFEMDGLSLNEEDNLELPAWLMTVSTLKPASVGTNGNGKG